MHVFHPECIAMYTDKSFLWHTQLFICKWRTPNSAKIYLQYVNVEVRIMLKIDFGYNDCHILMTWLIHYTFAAALCISRHLTVAWNPHLKMMIFMKNAVNIECYTVIVVPYAIWRSWRLNDIDTCSILVVLCVGIHCNSDYWWFLCYQLG